MNAQAWFIVGIVGFSLAGVLFVTAVLMFIKLNIPAIIGDLTGRTAAKQIEQFRQANAASGVKSHRPDPINVKRGTLTDKVEPRPGSAEPAAQARPAGASSGTTPLEGGNKGDGTSVLQEAGTTASLSPATTVLAQAEPANVTTVLQQEEPARVSNGTTVLSQPEAVEPEEKVPEAVASFVVTKDVVLVHTTEVI